MSIPLWLPWVILFVLLAALVLKPESSLRTSGPIWIVLIIAVWLTVDHFWVSEDELARATTDAAAAVDGSLGGVTQDRIRVEVEDRLGRPVEITRQEIETSDPTEDSYGFTVTVGDDEPAMCVKVTASSAGTSSGIGPEYTSVRTGRCTASSD